ncbi:MAG TPA: hypothetical protein PLL06_05035 [Acidobacteriota bacterium]|nr:hypothetical protein [Acidobacteriota bacterium]
MGNQERCKSDEVVADKHTARPVEGSRIAEKPRPGVEHRGNAGTVMGE